MANERKNVVVIGGAGFLGSHLCDELIHSHQVICVDNFVSGSQSNIDHLLSDPNFLFIKHDIVNPLDLESLPETERFRVKSRGVAEVYNLACPTSAKQFEEFKIQTLETNSWGTHNALELARKYKAKFLHFSSSVVYGARREDNAAFPENYCGYVNALSPRACYDEGRRFAEAAVATYQQVYKLDAKIVRVFRAYGPRMKLFDGQMIPDFITAALANQELVIYGDASFSTSLVYVSDVVDAAIKVMASAETGPFNVGSPYDVKLIDVAKQIIAMVESKSAVSFQQPLLFMTPLGLPDITLIKETLGRLPVVTLAEGLQKTIDYTKAEQNIVRG